jgi:adenylate kinase family enzyme
LQAAYDVELNAAVAAALHTDACRLHGYVLDGYPATAAQARSLPSSDAAEAPNRVFVFDAPDAVLVERGPHYRVDPATGNHYHLLSRPPPRDVPLARLLPHPALSAANIRDSAQVCKGGVFLWIAFPFFSFFFLEPRLFGLTLVSRGRRFGRICRRGSRRCREP